MTKIDEIENRGENGYELKFKRFSSEDGDTLLALARLAECYATGTTHPDGLEKYDKKLDRLTFNALVRKALGIAETPKEAVDRVFEENKDKFETHVDKGNAWVGGGYGKSVRFEDRFRPCGCILCICADEERCHGCGAKLCDEHTPKPLPPNSRRTLSAVDPAELARLREVERAAKWFYHLQYEQPSVSAKVIEDARCDLRAALSIGEKEGSNGQH